VRSFSVCQPAGAADSIEERDRAASPTEAKVAREPDFLLLKDTPVHFEILIGCASVVTHSDAIRGTWG